MGVPGTLWEHSAVKDCSGSYHTVNIIRYKDRFSTNEDFMECFDCCTVSLHHCVGFFGSPALG